jgi:cysteinyl-tRNA synthetase
MEDDFNTAAATGRLSEAFALANELCEKPPKGVDKAWVARTLFRLRDDFRRIAAVIGVFGADPGEWLARHRLRAAAQKGIDPAWVEERIGARAAARAAKDFAAADAVRGELKERGVEIMDTPGGTTWRVLV